MLFRQFDDESAASVIVEVEVDITTKALDMAFG
jgi:hypothetical protein